MSENKCSALIIGGSAGSLDVLLNVIPKLKETMSFPIVIVLHRKKRNRFALNRTPSLKIKPQGKGGR